MDMRHVVIAFSVAMLVAGCGRTPLNPAGGGALGDGGAQQDGLMPSPDGPRQQDGPVNVDGPRPPDAPVELDGPRPDAPRLDGPRPDAPRQDAAPQTDGGSTPGVIPCGTTTCNAATQQCCITLSGATCIARNAQCQGVTVTCDGPEDCSANQICCGRSYPPNAGLTCTNPNACSSGERICHVTADCPSGQECCGEGTIAGVSAKYCLPTASCPDISPTPGVPCGATSCFAPQVCCQGFGGAACTAANACTQGLALACDGPEDCGGTTPVCCGEIPGGTSCVASGTCQSGMTSGVVCHSSADCPSGETCTTIMGLPVRVCR